MKTTDFIFNKSNKQLEKGSVSWKAPSNIALVKYWGKKEEQIPMNPSISFTLDASTTITTLEFQYRESVYADKFDFKVYFDGTLKEDFKPKIHKFFKRIYKYVPFISDYTFDIYTKNTFPHSSGIASSASGMAALALCIMQMEKILYPDMTDEYFYKKASFLARLGSGSASRSVRGGIVVWGKHRDIEGSSNLYGIDFSDKVHPIFKNFHDTILLVDKGKKQVSSTLGHNLMNDNPYSKSRFLQAFENITKLKTILQIGDISSFIKLVESEALTLHAMMMLSHSYFILMKPKTLEIINKIWQFREETKTNICFTLDAGANVHVLYPDNEKEIINNFINKELVIYCEKGHYINDKIGNGSTIMNNKSV